MTDDVKAALARYRATMADERAQMDEGTFNALWGDDALILAHIDGEPTRTAAAVAAAREEQREACAQNFPKSAVAAPWAAELVRATPLTSQPLAARIAELEAEVACKHVTPDETPGSILLCGHLDDSPLRPFMRGLVERVEKAEAERDALKHELQEARNEALGHRHVREHAERIRDMAHKEMVEGRHEIASLTAERDALRAQVTTLQRDTDHLAAERSRWMAQAEAAEAQVEAARALCEPFKKVTHRASQYGDAMRDVLAAMDGAKP